MVVVVVCGMCGCAMRANYMNILMFRGSEWRRSLSAWTLRKPVDTGARSAFCVHTLRQNIINAPHVSYRSQ